MYLEPREIYPHLVFDLNRNRIHLGLDENEVLKVRRDLIREAQSRFRKEVDSSNPVSGLTDELGAIRISYFDSDTRFLMEQEAHEYWYGVLEREVRSIAGLV
jgi:hypothetical protein